MTHQWSGRRTGDGSREGFSRAFFALTQSWAAAIVVLLVSQFVLFTVVTQPLGTTERMQSFGWRLALGHLPTLVWALLATLAAARVYPEPHRHHLGRYLLACLTVPVASRLMDVSVKWGLVGTESLLVPSVAVLLGCFAGVALDRLVFE
ncbi:hypothetical protein [Streptomyces sp. NPDC005438]|uniref:hypothetical protein n=1 Tax=Streptomyces sp. NPDC005438 TaxID=3156880 RepID=UPI0033BE376B